MPETEKQVSPYLKVSSAHVQGSSHDDFTASPDPVINSDIVDFDGEEDPERPTNWPFKKKIVTTALYGITTMVSQLAISL